MAAERPDWVIIDPLKTIFPGIDQRSDTANECYRALRKLGTESNGICGAVCWAAAAELSSKNEATSRRFIEFLPSTDCYRCSVSEYPAA